MTWQETQWNLQPRRALTPTVLVSVEEATTIIAAITRAIATTRLRATVATTLPVDPLYICNTERLPAMHSKETRT